jgi:anti-sigma-K factor RskA
MDDFETCRRLLKAARAVPPDPRVPYAFEQRVMARLEGRKPEDAWALWGAALWRGAVFCLTLAVLLVVGSMFLPARNADTLPQAVENAMFAAVDNNNDQIGDTP